CRHQTVGVRRTELDHQRPRELDVVAVDLKRAGRIAGTERAAGLLELTLQSSLAFEGAACQGKISFEQAIVLSESRVLEIVCGVEFGAGADDGVGLVDEVAGDGKLAAAEHVEIGSRGIKS